MKIKTRTKLKTVETLHILAGRSITEKEDPIYKKYRQEWADRPLRQNAGAFPLHIDLESTSACNLRCSFCWAETMRDDGGFLKREIAVKIFEEGSLHGLSAVKFNLRGEPLLHPELHTLVHDSKQSGLVDVFFNTNGLLLTEEKSIQLIEAGLDRLTISCEGYNEESYRKYRDGASFDTLVNNVKTLQKMKKYFETNKPQVRVQAVLLPEIIPLLDKYKSFWETIADEVSCREYQDLDSIEDIVVSSWVCPFVFQRISVLWDGTVLPCDRDLKVENPLGNVKDVSIHKIWTGDFINKMRQSHIAGRSHEVDICRRCPFREREIKKLEIKLANE